MEIREETDLPWAAQTVPLHGTQYVVQQMDHPDNQFDMRWSAYREYGLLGAFFEETLAPGEQLTAKFGFSVTRGDQPADTAFKSTYDEYVDRA